MNNPLFFSLAALCIVAGLAVYLAGALAAAQTQREQARKEVTVLRRHLETCKGLEAPAFLRKRLVDAIQTERGRLLNLRLGLAEADPRWRLAHTADYSLDWCIDLVTVQMAQATLDWCLDLTNQPTRPSPTTPPWSPSRVLAQVMRSMKACGQCPEIRPAADVEEHDANEYRPAAPVLAQFDAR